MTITITPHNDDRTTVTVSHPNDDRTTVTVSHPNDDLTVDKVFDELVIPALLAWGFSQKLIDNYLDREP